MELINHTAYPSLMFRTGLEGEKMAASIAIRATYDIVAGKAVPSSNQEWQLFKEDQDTEYGPVANDNVYRRGGVDVLVFGNAISPNGKPLKVMKVEVNIKNKLSVQLLVFGNRVWEKSVAGINISEPEPFTEMPVSLHNAFGGKAQWDGLEMLHGNNPYGKGYYWQKEDAINNPLPNIEDPANTIYKWNDQPDPVGLASCPMCELHMRGNVLHTKEGQITEITPRFFNSAFPAMIVESVAPGEKIAITGMTKENPFVFEIPDHHLKTKLSIGENIKEWRLNIEQVGIFPGKNKAFITYRFPFNYTLRPHELRTCEIFENQ